MEFDLKRLGLGQRIAAVGAVLLFIFFFFFDWYGVDLGQFSAGISGWDAHTLLRWLVLLTIIATLGAVYLRVSDTDLATPVSPSVIVGGIAAVTTLLIAFRVIINHPGPSGAGIGTEIGAWLGLLSLIAITVGAYLSMQEDGVSLSDPSGTMSTAATSPAAPPQATPPEAPSESSPTGS